MKILFLAHRLPYPPNKGEKIRGYHVIGALAERHEVSLVCWVDDVRELKDLTLLKKLCRLGVWPFKLNGVAAIARGLGAVLAGKSFSEGYFFSPLVERAVNQRIQEDQYDLIYVCSSPMAQYVSHHSSIPTLVDFVDVDSEKWGESARYKPFPISKLMRLEQLRLSRYELAVSQWARCSVFVSPVEAELFKSMGAKGTIVHMGNGVDSKLRKAPLARTGHRIFGASATEVRAAKLIFTGTMSYFPNADAVLYFTREIFPLIRKDCPGVTFDVVGRHPTRAVRRLNRIGGVRVVGEVKDVRPFLVQADISIAPFRIARGLQNKILEAMAAGIPVVATSKATAGLLVKSEEEILVGDTPEEFARQVVRLIQDRALYERIAKKARSRVLESYDWKTVGSQLQTIAERFSSKTTDSGSEKRNSL